MNENKGADQAGLAVGDPSLCAQAQSATPPQAGQIRRAWTDGKRHNAAGWLCNQYRIDNAKIGCNNYGVA